MNHNNDTPIKFGIDGYDLPYWCCVVVNLFLWPCGAREANPSKSSQFGSIETSVFLKYTSRDLKG